MKKKLYQYQYKKNKFCHPLPHKIETSLSVLFSYVIPHYRKYSNMNKPNHFCMFYSQEISTQIYQIQNYRHSQTSFFGFSLNALPTEDILIAQGKEKWWTDKVNTAPPNKQEVADRKYLGLEKVYQIKVHSWNAIIKAISICSVKDKK